MRRKIFIGVIIFLIVGITLFIKYGLFIVMYLTTPPLREYTLEEKVFIDSLKMVCQCKKVTREPKWDYGKKRVQPYAIIFSDINSKNFINEDSLKKQTFKIAKQAYAINHGDTTEFKEYWIDIFGESGGEVIYKYHFKDFKLQ